MKSKGESEMSAEGSKVNWGHKRDAKDLITAKLPALHFYQLAMPAPKAPAGSYDTVPAQRGQALFNDKAICSDCHVSFGMLLWEWCD